MVSRVLIADDSAFMRRLLRQTLESRCEIVAEAENGVEAVELYDETAPDLVVMDSVMPIKDGIEATAQLTSDHPDARVIVCTRVGQEGKVKQAAEAGARASITKPFQKANVLEAIETVVGT